MHGHLLLQAIQYQYGQVSSSTALCRRRTSKKDSGTNHRLRAGSIPKGPTSTSKGRRTRQEHQWAISLTNRRRVGGQSRMGGPCLKGCTECRRSSELLHTASSQRGRYKRQAEWLAAHRSPQCWDPTNSSCNQLQAHYHHWSGESHRAGLRWWQGRTGGRLQPAQTRLGYEWSTTLKTENNQNWHRLQKRL